MFCPKCGAQQPDSGSFCRHCGVNLRIVSDAMSGAAGTPLAKSTSSGNTFALFNHTGVSNEHQSLDGHNAASVFGSVVIDLTAKPLPPEELRISAYLVFGSIDILVPDEVGVRITGVSLFSGVKIRGRDLGNGFFSVDEYVSPDYASAPRRVHVDATSIFSAVKVRR